MPSQRAVRTELAFHMLERYEKAMNPMTTGDANRIMAARFSLDDEQRGASYRSGRNQWVAIVGYAKLSLKLAGFIRPVARDQWIITELGIRKLKEAGESGISAAGG